MSVSFFVPGHARPAGSKDAGAVTRIDRTTGMRVPVLRANGMPMTFVKDSSGKAGEAWRADVRAAAMFAMGDRSPLTGPLAMATVFYRMRPRGHYGSGRNLGTVKRSAPTYPTGRPDVTKLLRAVEDAMTGICYLDDAQIVEIVARKAWATDQPGVAVTLSRVGGQVSHLTSV